MAADPFVVHVARLRRSPGQTEHVVRRGEVALAGPLEEAGIDPGRSVVPPGAEAEADLELISFEGGIQADGHRPGPLGGDLPPLRRAGRPASWRSGCCERFGDDADEDFYPITDDTIDLGPLVRDAIVLELPMAPLCRDDCAGLCPQCGANRNEGDCSCVAPRDPAMG